MSSSLSHKISYDKKRVLLNMLDQRLKRYYVKSVVGVDHATTGRRLRLVKPVIKSKVGRYSSVFGCELLFEVVDFSLLLLQEFNQHPRVGLLDRPLISCLVVRHHFRMRLL